MFSSLLAWHQKKELLFIEWVSDRDIVVNGLASNQIDVIMVLLLFLFILLFFVCDNDGNNDHAKPF